MVEGAQRGCRLFCSPNGPTYLARLQRGKLGFWKAIQDVAAMHFLLWSAATGKQYHYHQPSYNSAGAYRGGGY